MEHSTFQDENVRATLDSDFTVLRVQAEDPNDPATAALLSRLGVNGLPAFRVIGATPAP